MEGFLLFFSQFLVISIFLYSLYLNIKYITKPNIISPFIIVFIIFFVIPIFADLILGIPNYYGSFSGFNIPVRNISTRIIYNIYVSFILCIFIVSMRKREYLFDSESIKKILFSLSHYLPILLIITLLPVLLLFFVDNPTSFLFYRALNPNYELEDDIYTKILINSTMLSVIAGALGICSASFCKNKISNFLFKILFFLLSIMSIVINGKRFIVPLFLIAYFCIKYFSRIRSRAKVLISLLLVVLLFVAFINFYGKGITNNWDFTYQYLRVDFGRDDVMKYTIFNEFFLEKPILEYKGQSFLFDITFFIPREIWEEKPYPYAQYFTSHLVGKKQVGGLGWSMTTSIFEECLANLGYLGFFSPLFFLFLVRRINKIKTEIPKLLGIVILLMLLVVQFSALTQFFAIFVILMLGSVFFSFFRRIMRVDRRIGKRIN